MDIRNWPLGQILQLPDFCFGRRWLVSCTTYSVAGEPFWDIAEIAFPENIVLWEWGFWTYALTTAADRWRLALGDQLPTTVAMMDALEPFIPGFGEQGMSPRSIRFPYNTSGNFVRLRQPIHTGGRRLVLECDANGTLHAGMMVGVVVSSIPTEVPDCLLSG
ncbi:hypothetical protein ES703_73335 [subsurface metagenome]